MPYAVIDAAKWGTQPYTKPEFVIDHIIPKKSLLLWSGDTGTAKSTFALAAAVAHAHQTPLANWFKVHVCKRPVLICQGEMGSEDLQRYFSEVVAGYNLGPVAQEKVLFQGSDGIAEFRFGAHPDQRNTDFEDLLKVHNPCLVFIDTLREHIEIDENDASQVRPALSWLKQMALQYDASIMVLHHWRKTSGTGSNNARERVSGSRDLVSKPDLHLAFVGRPVNELRLDKTRTPVNDVRTGTRWFVQSTRDDSITPPQATFLVSAVSNEPEGVPKSEAGIEECKAKILASLADGAQTREQLGATGGNTKRAYEELVESGAIVASTKEGRKQLYSLANSQDVKTIEPQENAGEDSVDADFKPDEIPTNSSEHDRCAATATALDTSTASLS